MQFRTYYPKSRLLSEHIAYFYFIQSDLADFTTTYYAFPHLYNGLSIYRSAGYHVTANSLTTYSDMLNNHRAFLQSRYQFPLKITLNGPIDKVTIVFKPLGINYFIDAYFADITRQVSQPFDQWSGNDYKNFLTLFFATDDFDLRTESARKIFNDGVQTIHRSAYYEKSSGPGS